MDNVSSFERLTLVTDGQKSVNPFNSLPNEVLELIFTHIRPKTLVQNVLPVCRRFYSILSNEKLWYRRLKAYPLNIRLCEEEISSDDFCIVRTFDAIVSDQTRYQNWNEQGRFVTTPTGGFAGGLKLFKNAGQRMFCLSAVPSSSLTNHFIKLWSVDKMNGGYAEDDCLLAKCATRTFRFFGDIVMHGTEQFAANMDYSVKLWDIGQSTIRVVDTRNFAQRTTFVSLYDRILAASKLELEAERTSFSLLDVRNGLQEISQFSYVSDIPGDQINGLHQKDNTLYVLYAQHLFTIDIRKSNVPLQIHKFENPDEGIQASMDFADGLIYCCHEGGEVTVLRERDLQPCHTFKVGHEPRRCTRQLTKCKGSFLALTPTTLQAYSLGMHPVQLGYYDKFSSVTCEMDTLDGAIVVGGYDGSITTWTNYT